MTTINEPGELTDEQRELYGLVEANGTRGTVLLSVIEKATGQQRAVICTVGYDGGEYVMRPIALLLEQEQDMDRFIPPSDEVQTHEGHDA